MLTIRTSFRSVRHLSVQLAGALRRKEPEAKFEVMNRLSSAAVSAFIGGASNARNEHLPVLRRQRARLGHGHAENSACCCRRAGRVQPTNNLNAARIRCTSR